MKVTKEIMFALVFFTLLLLVISQAFAKDPMYIYHYNHPVLKKVGVYAEDRYYGLRKAAKVCFKELDGRYERGEEALKIIDICANPYKIEVR